MAEALDPLVSPESSEALVPTEHHLSWTQRFAIFRERPLGRLTTTMVAALALMGSDRQAADSSAMGSGVSRSIVAEQDGNNTDISLVIGEGDASAKIYLTDWKEVESNAGLSIRRPEQGS